VSLRPDGAYRCDRCGTDVGNGAVTEAAVISDLQLVEDLDVHARPRTLHLCRKPRRGAPHGCAGYVLGPRVLAAYPTSKETHS
jgi:hypothetical protein